MKQIENLEITVENLNNYNESAYFLPLLLSVHSFLSDVVCFLSNYFIFHTLRIFYVTLAILDCSSSPIMYHKIVKQYQKGWPNKESLFGLFLHSSLCNGDVELPRQAITS